jgi:hypothetical protein
LDCPDCGRHNEESDRCYACGCDLRGLTNSSDDLKEFTVADFFIDNTSLFTTLGVVGALSLFLRAISTKNEQSIVVVTLDYFVNNLTQIIGAQPTSDPSFHQYGISACYTIILLILAILSYRAVSVTYAAMQNPHQYHDKCGSAKILIRLLIMWTLVWTPVFVISLVVITHSLTETIGLNFLSEVLSIVFGLIVILILTYALEALLHFILKSHFQRLKLTKLFKQYNIAFLATFALWFFVLCVSSLRTLMGGSGHVLPFFIETTLYGIAYLLATIFALFIVCICIKFIIWLKKGFHKLIPI